jgi:ppGpp synthetase/RelA/SpoT-type nucleotidyltranferase
MEGLDLHCEMIMDEYRESLPMLERMKEEVLDTLREALDRNGLVVTAVEARVKTAESLAGKLALKGAKYAQLSDITDILGARIITFYTDDVDRIAAMAEQLFDIDWENSVDKRKLHQLDSFGYNSLHYICRLPDYPLRFELQLRTTLQHAWAAINHDTGYKTGVEIPREYMRQMNRLAGMLEMVDDEFSRIRTELTDYRRRVHQLVQNGKLDDVMLDGDTFRSYLQARPLDALNKRIAAINQAEIQEAPLIRYLRVLKALGCKTLGDVSRLIKKYEDDAYRLARHQLGNTDLDIISSAVGLQNICIVCILTTGGGKIGLLRLFDVLNGHNSQNEELAELTFNQANSLRFIN